MNTTQRENCPSEAKPITAILKTLETLGLQPLAPDTANSSRSSYSDKMLNASAHWKQNWLEKRLSLELHHPSLNALQEAVWAFCCGFASNPSKGRKLVVYGNNGTGKSKCAKAVRRWVRDRAIELPLVAGEYGASLAECALVNWAERVNAFKSGDWDIEDLINCPMLILDDIGAEHDPSKCGAEKLYMILERREWKWTMITTNVITESWEARFERRISDRLLRNSVIVDLTKVPSYSVNT